MKYLLPTRLCDRPIHIKLFLKYGLMRQVLMQSTLNCCLVQLHSTSEDWFEFQLLHFPSNFLQLHPGRWEMITQIFEVPSPLWEIWMEFQLLALLYSSHNDSQSWNHELADGRLPPVYLYVLLFSHMSLTSWICAPFQLLCIQLHWDLLPLCTFYTIPELTLLRIHCFPALQF